MTPKPTHRLGYGDTVLVYIDEKRRFLVKLRRDGVLGTDKGFIKHEWIVGRRYGDAVELSRGGHAYLLEPLPHDAIHCYRRATQIIYPKDSGFMALLSGIGPRSIVVEAGVGSGALTTVLAWLVGDSGRVYGFDIRRSSIEAASRNLEASGLSGRVELILHDIRESIPVDGVDAVFLDMPDPWSTLDHVWGCLRGSRPVVIYVPTVNQVEKTVLALRRHGGFIDIHAYEILLREYIVEEGATRPSSIMIGHTGYIVFARKVYSI